MFGFGMDTLRLVTVLQWLPADVRRGLAWGGRRSFNLSDGLWISFHYHYGQWYCTVRFTGARLLRGHNATPLRISELGEACDKARSLIEDRFDTAHWLPPFEEWIVSMLDLVLDIEIADRREILDSIWMAALPGKRRCRRFGTSVFLLCESSVIAVYDKEEQVSARPYESIQYQLRARKHARSRLRVEFRLRRAALRNCHPRVTLLRDLPSEEVLAELFLGRVPVPFRFHRPVCPGTAAIKLKERYRSDRVRRLLELWTGLVEGPLSRQPGAKSFVAKLRLLLNAGVGFGSPTPSTDDQGFAELIRGQMCRHFDKEPHERTEGD